MEEVQEFRPPAMSHAALFGRFLRFGFNAFGGPVAQIAMIRRELVEQERWIDPAGFNRLLAVMQVLPGPEAHELCVHLGIRAKGRLGGLLAGLGFMLPGLLLMLALAALYSSMATSVAGGFGPLFLGVQAAVLAVVLLAVIRIGRHILTDAWLWVIALAAAALTLAGASFWLVLPTAGLAFAALRGRRPVLLLLLVPLAVAAFLLPAGASSAAPLLSAGDAAPWLLFIAGLKAGLLTFGGAYTAIPFVRDDTVGRGWMSDGQFLDGVALATVLPAPLVVFATFAGWLSGGPAGAIAITAGIFLPAFSFSLLFYERLEAVVDDARLQHFLAGVAAAVVGLIAVTLGDLASAAARQTPDVTISAFIFVVALAILLTWRRAIVTPLVLALAAAAGFLLLG
jgi:chromate transporter